MKFIQTLLILSVVFALSATDALSIEKVAYFVEIEAANNTTKTVTR